MAKDKYNFYFTFGSEGHPYVGGWSVVEAPDMGRACEVFRAYHPDVIEGRLNCCSVYHEETWGSTIMAVKGLNLGAGCHEIIHWEVQK